MATLGCVALIVGITLLVFLIRYLLMLEKISKQLKQQAHFARAPWAAHAFTPQAGPQA